jgi:hypothetical protein
VLARGLWALKFHFALEEAFLLGDEFLTWWVCWLDVQRGEVKRNDELQWAGTSLVISWKVLMLLDLQWGAAKRNEETLLAVTSPELVLVWKVLKWHQEQEETERLVCHLANKCQLFLVESALGPRLETVSWRQMKEWEGWWESAFFRR